MSVHRWATMLATACIAVMSVAESSLNVHGTFENTADLVLAQHRAFMHLADNIAPPADTGNIAPQPKANLTHACKNSVEKDRRIALILLDPPFHGSTAVSGVLMSSQKLATLCSYQAWQCEGSRIMHHAGFSVTGKNWDYSRMLDLYSNYWDLQRPVLYDKSNQISTSACLRLGMDEVQLPTSMTSHGIRRLDRAYIIMWRPLCLGALSSHFGGTEEEVSWLVATVSRHRELVSRGEPVLVINYGDFLWQPARNQQRLNEFLPCLGDVQMDYVPKMNIDIYEPNDWKAESSVVAYGESIDPASSNYDVERQKCVGGDGLDSLDERNRKLALEAIEYLGMYS